MLKHKDAMREAIDQLIVHYNRFEPDETPRSARPSYAGCPLCAAVHDNCNRCPWKLFEGSTCVAAYYVGQTTAERLERLERWKNIIIDGQGGAPC